jgi:transposase
MKKKGLTYYNFQFKHTVVTVTNHSDIQTVNVAESLNIHPIMLYRWRGGYANRQPGNFFLHNFLVRISSIPR